MDVDIKATISLDEDAIRQAIAEYIEKQSGIKIDPMMIEWQYSGEYEDQVFSGASVTLDRSAISQHLFNGD